MIRTLCVLQGPEGAHVEAMARIPCQVLLPAVPADCRVCLGLAGGSLLDITLPYRQRHAAVCSGVVLFLEDLVQKWAKVSAFLWEMVGITGVVKRHQWWRSPLKCFLDLEWGVILCWREMAQQFRTSAALGEDWRSVPSTYIGHLQLPAIPTPGNLTSSSGLWGYCLHVQKPLHIHII